MSQFLLKIQFNTYCARCYGGYSKACDQGRFSARCRTLRNLAVVGAMSVLGGGTHCTIEGGAVLFLAKFLNQGDVKFYFGLSIYCALV